MTTDNEIKGVLSSVEAALGKNGPQWCSGPDSPSGHEFRRDIHEKAYVCARCLATRQVEAGP